jgi:hypothetical protein
MPHNLAIINDQQDICYSIITFEHENQNTPLRFLVWLNQVISLWQSDQDTPHKLCDGEYGDILCQTQQDNHSFSWLVKRGIESWDLNEPTFILHIPNKKISSLRGTVLQQIDNVITPISIAQHCNNLTLTPLEIRLVKHCTTLDKRLYVSGRLAYDILSNITLHQSEKRKYPEFHRPFGQLKLDKVDALCRTLHSQCKRHPSGMTIFQKERFHGASGKYDPNILGGLHVFYHNQWLPLWQVFDPFFDDLYIHEAAVIDLLLPIVFEHHQQLQLPLAI